MNLPDLRQALDLSSGTLTLGRDTLNSALKYVLDNCFLGQPIAITEAAAGSAEGETVVITGRSSLFQSGSYPLVARFSLTASGEVQATLRYQLRDTQPEVNPWTFSRNFAKLPTVWNYTTAVSGTVDTRSVLAAQRPFVDSLYYYDTYYVVATHAGKDPELGVPLCPGLNFVSHLRPDGALGVLEGALGSTTPLTLYGPLHVPLVTDQTLALGPFERPWDRPQAPGIHLQAPLHLDFKLGKLSFSQAAFRVYSPLSTQWQRQNQTYHPLHGYSGRLAIPSAGIEMEVAADVLWGRAGAYLYAKCQGLTLGKLSHLADLAGTSSLAALLPQELQTALDKLERLELIDLSGTLAVVNGALALSAVTVTIGMPNLNWKVYGDHLELRSLSCRFQIADPTSNPTVTATIMGTIDIEGVPLAVFADVGNNFTLYARLDSAQTIPLAALMKQHAPGVPAPSELTVSRMSVAISPGRFYQMSMLLADQPKPWLIPVGRMNIAVEKILFELSAMQGGAVTGQFSGTASFGDNFQVAVSLSTPGSAILRGTFHNLQLRKLLSMLSDQPAALPPGFDVGIETLSVLVSKRGSDYVFQSAAEIASFGTLAFEARKFASGQSGFAAGISLSTTTLSKLQGLEALAALERIVKLQKLLVVLSSFDDAQFVFPDMAAFNQPVLATKSLALPAGSGGVKAGLNILAEWTLDSGDKQQNLIKALLGLEGTQQVVIQVGENPAKNSRLMVTRRAKLQGRPFDCKFGVQLDNGVPSFFLAGSLRVEIQKQPQTFDLTTMFVSGGAFLSATMKGMTAVDCGPFKLSNLALEVGVNWAGIPSLGVAANIDFKDFSSSVAVFFDSADPTRSLVAGSISNLTARDILRAFVGGVQTPLDDLLQSIALRGTHEFAIPGDLTDELDGLVLDKVSAAFAAAKVTIPSLSQQLTIVPKTRGASWHLTDLTKMRHYQLEKKGDKIQVEVAPQFYFAPQATAIGSINFPQAFYLNAAFSFAGFEAQATIDVSPNRGFAIDAQFDKVVFVDEKLFSIAALQGGGGPKLSVSTFAQPDNPVEKFRLPHFYLNGSLTLLGLKQGVYASVSVHGIEFELVGNLVPGVHFDLDARFGKGGFGANGKLKIGVGTVDLGKLGKAKLNTELEVDLDLDIDTGAKDVSLQPGASYPPGTTLLTHDRATLVFQDDSNLVLYKHSGEPVWASNTSGRGATNLAFQSDGNLVIYTSHGPIWASGSNCQNIGRLTLQSDGNVVIYDSAGHARWATGTNGSWATAGAHLELESSFEFAGQHLAIPKFHIDATADTFTQLPAIIAKKVEAALGEVFKDMTKWANAVKNGVMDGVDDTAKVFKEVYGKSEQEAKALASTVGKDAGKATKAVENVAKDVGKTTEKTAKKVIKKVKFW